MLTYCWSILSLPSACVLRTFFFRDFLRSTRLFRDPAALGSHVGANVFPKSSLGNPSGLWPSSDYPWQWKIPMWLCCFDVFFCNVVHTPIKWQLDRNDDTPMDIHIYIYIFIYIYHYIYIHKYILFNRIITDAELPSQEVHNETPNLRDKKLSKLALCSGWPNCTWAARTCRSNSVIRPQPWSSTDNLTGLIRNLVKSISIPGFCWSNMVKSLRNSALYSHVWRQSLDFVWNPSLGYWFLRAKTKEIGDWAIGP